MHRTDAGGRKVTAKRRFAGAAALASLGVSRATAAAEHRRRPRLLVVVCTSLALLALSVATQPAMAAEKAIWGPTILPDGQPAFPMYERLGVDTLQFSLDWSSIAPTRPADPRNPDDPAYRWPAEVDFAVRESPRHGIRLALLALFSPSWANGGRSREWAPEPSHYADFLAAAARRYRYVRRWMIWSEPNKALNFKPSVPDDPIAARTYALLLGAAYVELKRASRNNKVIGGMTWSGGDVKPAPFLREMRLPGGRRPRMDWFGHNPFPFRYPQLSEPPLAGGWRDMSDLDTYAREIRRAYGRELPFWLSEFTIQSDQASGTFAHFVPRRVQGRWVTQAYRIADREAPVAGLGWLGLIDAPPGEGNEFFGLLTHDLARKPSYFAYLRAPSERHAPRISAARTIRASSLARRGLRLTIRPQTTAVVTVHLRRRGRGRPVVTRRVGRIGKRTHVRLRTRNARPGAYELLVSSSRRGATVRRSLRVR